TATPPTVTGVDPSSRGQGASNQTITIAGTGFGGANGPFGGTLAFSGAGITVNSVTRTSSTQLTANIPVSATGPAGSRAVRVTNAGGGSASCNNCFVVTARPTISSVSPNSLGQGATSQSITVNGSNFPSNFVSGGGSVSFSGSGITVNSVTRSSSTRLTVVVS